jgi:trehalose/maltose hydrolase-like predicted phosphorylase
VHYPGTYLAGVYNRLASTLGGEPVQIEHLINAPDWAFLTVRMDGADGRRRRAEPGVDDILRLHPLLPSEVKQASFDLCYRGQPVSIELTQRRAKLRLLPCSAGPIRLCVEGIEKSLQPGEEWEVQLPGP